jgi:DinB superfamily
MRLARPRRGDCDDYYFTYIDRVPEGDVLALLHEQMVDTSAFLRELADDAANHRYAPGKWSVKDVIGHVIDTERVFSHRAFCFARQESAHLPAFEQDPYVEAAGYGSRTPPSLGDEYEAVRRATIVLFETFGEAQWDSVGVASERKFLTRTIPFILAGHEIHHRAVLEERYGVR